MPGPLTGTKVVEMASWAALPGGGAILTDWGAEVVKVEEPGAGGDPTRAFSLTKTADGKHELGPVWEQNNRNKKSVALDARPPEGQAVLRRLLEQADVFITSTRPQTLERLGLSYADLEQLNPRLILLHLSGYGPKGPDAERPGFDMLCFWARSGLALAMAGEDGIPVNQRPAIGDHSAALAIAGAVAAALYQREKTGHGQFIQTSLYHTGLWVNSYDTVASLISRKEARSLLRDFVQNPLVNSYKTTDGWIQLVSLQSDRWWAPFCRAVGRSDLIGEQRYASAASRANHGAELVQLFSAEFAKQATAAWQPRLDAESIPWGKIQSVLDATTDPQAHANNYFQRVEHLDAGTLELVTSPVQFGGQPSPITSAAPMLGQHTEEVLLEAGYSWDEIGVLKDKGVIL